MGVVCRAATATCNSGAKCNQDSEGVIKVLGCKKTDRMLGVYMVAPAAGELIGEAVLAMEHVCSASCEDVARMCVCVCVCVCHARTLPSPKPSGRRHSQRTAAKQSTFKSVSSLKAL